MLTESSVSQETPVLEEMRSLGGNILSVVDHLDLNLSELGKVVELNSGALEAARPVLYLPVLQLLAYYRAISQGQDPDNPHNLDAVVHIPSLVM